MNIKSRGWFFNLLNMLSAFFTPGYSQCGGCKGYWNVVKSHVTDYSSYSGIFALCETCWQELETPEARMPFYEVILTRWRDSDTPYSVELQIRAAVLAGR